MTLGVVGCGTATGVCGCLPQDSCRDTLTCQDDGEPDEPFCIADPALGRADNDCGVFASSSLGNDQNPGTREQPVRTLVRAIALARSERGRVYACGETFWEAITVPSGVEVWGGLDCTHDWIYPGGNNRTVIAPGPDLIPLTVEQREGGGISTLADLHLEAADALLPGGSSIAMLVRTRAEVELLRSVLIARNGAKGEPGARGGEMPAPAGTPGNPGATACSADIVSGAPPVTSACEITSIGGKGGDGRNLDGANGNNGQPEPQPNPDARGLGGTGQAGNVQCADGTRGLNGIDGVHGLGGRGPGTIAFNGWEGVMGGDGTSGRVAQGGGGGGGSRGGSLFCVGAATPKGGASGGSGGGGGCGGQGGKGGGFGGASIGLVTFSGQVSVHATSILTGNGGDGGAGGLSQFGGAGGVRGLGGAGVGGSQAGCHGGDGGSGGNGGYGGGGLGGPSLGVAHVLAQPAALRDSTIQIGLAGKGGPGGNQNVPGSDGEDGIRGEMLAIP